MSNRTGPVARRDEDFIGPIVHVLVRESAKKVQRLGLVRFHAVGGWLAGPADDRIRPVALRERIQILGVPGVVERLHQLFQMFFAGHGGPFRRSSGRRTSDDEAG